MYIGDPGKSIYLFIFFLIFRPATSLDLQH